MVAGYSQFPTLPNETLVVWETFQTKSFVLKFFWASPICLKNFNTNYYQSLRQVIGSGERELPDRHGRTRVRKTLLFYILPSCCCLLQAIGLLQLMTVLCTSEKLYGTPIEKDLQFPHAVKVIGQIFLETLLIWKQ